MPETLSRFGGPARPARGPSAHTALVEMERADGTIPAVAAFEAPTILSD